MLGPTLFSLYARDISSVVSPPTVEIIQFADDIMLKDSASDSQIVSANLSNAVTNLSHWLRQRGLIMNETKSQVLWFNLDGCPPPVVCNNVRLPDVEEAKYLGVIFDRKMSWIAHTQMKATAVSKLIGALCRAKNSLSVDAKWLYYSSVIMSNLTYGSNAIIANLPSSCADRLVKLQKKALRAIYGLPPWAHTAPIFVQFSENSSHDKMLQKLATLVWRTQNGRCGSLLANMFCTRKPIGYATRGASTRSLALPTANKLSGLKRPTFQGCVLWNSLPAAARICGDKKSFVELLPRIFPPSY